eukprot:3069867-Prymnesium_polylepis.2
MQLSRRSKQQSRAPLLRKVVHPVLGPAPARMERAVHEHDRRSAVERSISARRPVEGLHLQARGERDHVRRDAGARTARSWA